MTETATTAAPARTLPNDSVVAVYDTLDQATKAIEALASSPILCGGRRRLRRRRSWCRLGRCCLGFRRGRRFGRRGGFGRGCCLGLVSGRRSRGRRWRLYLCAARGEQQNERDCEISHANVLQRQTYWPGPHGCEPTSGHPVLYLYAAGRTCAEACVDYIIAAFGARTKTRDALAFAEPLPDACKRTAAVCSWRSGDGYAEAALAARII